MTHNEVSQILNEMVAGHADPRQPPGVAEDLRGDRAALGAVAIEKLLIGEFAFDEGELPRQIEGVLHSGIHPLATRRAMDVGGVASDEHPPNAIVFDLALVDPKSSQPDWS